MKPLTFYLIYIAVMSLAAFFAYEADKRRSVKGRWRISEKTLLGLGLLGGAPGGLLGMKIFRHKTKHRYFWAVNFLGIILHAALLFWLIRSA